MNIMFSRVFPSYHENAGVETNFVEKIWAGLREKLGDETMHAYLDEISQASVNKVSWYQIAKFKKIHTIRAGERWKQGDIFSPRIWSEKPYRSKQIIFAPPLTVNKIYPFEYKEGQYYFDGILMHDSWVEEVANNDGLNFHEFKSWFNKPFKGQIILFGDNPY